MKRAANKTGGGGVALWQPTLKAAAPCFLIFFHGPPKQARCVCSCSLCGRQLVRFTGETKYHVVEVVIKSINFGIYLIHCIKHILLALLVFPYCVMQIEATYLDFLTENYTYLKRKHV